MRAKVKKKLGSWGLNLDIQIFDFLLLRGKTEGILKYLPSIDAIVKYLNPILKIQRHTQTRQNRQLIYPFETYSVEEEDVFSVIYVSDTCNCFYSCVF